MKVRDTQRKEKTEKSSLHSSTSWMDIIVKRKQFLPGFPRGSLGPNDSVHAALLFPGHQQGSGSEIEQSIDKLAPKWKADTTGR